jgi:hypothetical protein
MVYLKKKNDSRKYRVRNQGCIGAECLVLGLVRHRGATGRGGSRNTGAITACCLTNASHGCPLQVRYSAKMIALRRKEGIKVAK